MSTTHGHALVIGPDPPAETIPLEYTPAEVVETAYERDRPIVAGSDAPAPFEVGRAYTLVDANVCTPASVVEAIRDGRVEPYIATGSVDELLRHGYRRIRERTYHDDLPARPAVALERVAETRIDENPSGQRRVLPELALAFQRGGSIPAVGRRQTPVACTRNRLLTFLRKRSPFRNYEADTDPHIL